MVVLAEGAFARAAMALWQHDLAVTPTGGEDGKRPLLKDYPNKLLGPEAISRLSKSKPTANVALLTGLSKLAVIDIDDHNQFDAMIKRFGDTPLIGQTGRGGFQLYYQGTKCAPCDFRMTEGIKVELKTQGTIVVVPPSVNFKTGGQYQLVRGSWDDLGSLPPFKVSALPREEVVGHSGPGRVVQEGHRNNWLFSQLLRHAPYCDTPEELLDVAYTRAGEHFDQILSDAEIEKIARSAWGYQLRGENWVGQAARLMITKDELLSVADGVANNGDCALLYWLLKLEHGARHGRGESFALVTEAMARDGVLPGWGVKRYRAAIDALLAKQLIRKVRHGRGPGWPSLYVLGNPFPSGTQCNGTLPPQGGGMPCGSTGTASAGMVAARGHGAGGTPARHGHGASGEHEGRQATSASKARAPLTTDQAKLQQSGRRTGRR